MGMIRKSVLSTVLLFVILSILPMGCGLFCSDSCGCGPNFPPQTFRINSFEIFTAAFDGQQIFPSTFLPYDKVFKAIRVKNFDLLGELKSPKFQGLNMAFACSPPSPTSSKKLVDIQIVNLNEVTFGDGTILEPGQNISELFAIGYFYSNSLKSIPEFIEDGYTLYLEDLLKLGIRKNPGKEISLEVSISIVLQDGSAFTFQNEIWSLQPNS